MGKLSEETRAGRYNAARIAYTVLNHENNRICRLDGSASGAERGLWRLMDKMQDEMKKYASAKHCPY